MADYAGRGIFNGLLNGLKEGFITAQNVANIKNQQRMQELALGVKKDPTTGDFSYTPEKQQEIAAHQAQYKQTIAESTPDSDVAKASSEALGSAGYKVPAGLSYTQQKGLIEPLVLGKYKIQAAAAAAGARNEHQDAMLEKRLRSTQEGGAQTAWKGQFGATAPTTQRLEGASRILNLIQAGEEGKIATTKQFLNRANAEVSALETGKNNFALGSQERTELESSAADIQALLNKVFNKQEGTDLGPALKELKANMHDMSDSYMDQAERTATQLEEGAPEYGAESLKKKHGLMKQQYQKVFGHWGRQEPHGLVPAPAGGAAPVGDEAAKVKRLQELKAKAGV